MLVCTHQKKKIKINLLVLDFSSSIKLFLLEWILSSTLDYSCIVLYFCNSTEVEFRLFFINTLVMFCSFFSLPANRIQISSTLLLTSITFRWTVNRSLVSFIFQFILIYNYDLFFQIADNFVFNIIGYIRNYLYIYISYPVYLARYYRSCNILKYIR
jgi:hypothetical protein